VNRYRRRPLLLVQVNIEQDRIRIFYVFTHLTTDSNVVCLIVCFFSFLPQIWMIPKQYLIIKQQF
jgi:hypothetical protein